MSRSLSHFWVTSNESRIIAAFQVLWFACNTVFRAIQGLMVTTLELTTIAFIVCMLATSIFWRHKPTGISKPIVLRSKYTISEILIKAGPAAKDPYRYTPLDFVSRKEWSISILWNHDQVILSRLGIRAFSRPNHKRPIDRIPNDNWPAVTGWAWLLCVGLTACYCSLFVCGWNFEFPSLVEHVFWKVASLGTLGLVLMGFVLELYGLRNGKLDVDLWMEKRQRLPQYHNGRSHDAGQRTWLGKVVGFMRNNSPDKDPAFNKDLHVHTLLMLLCAVYTIFRGYILVEDVIGLRSLPASAFETIEWSQYLPHI